MLGLVVAAVLALIVYMLAYNGGGTGGGAGGYLVVAFPMDRLRTMIRRAR